jgi:hypothetical protein
MNARAALAAACLPSPRQELLVRAALLEGDAAAHAWEQWKRAAGEQTLDVGSARLLPLVHRNLLRLGIDEPRLREAYRQTRTTNEHLFSAIGPVLNQLQEAGVRTMLLKGAALTVLVYGDPGFRTMHDIDVLVPRGDAATAVRVMCDGGWTTDLPLLPFHEAHLPRHGQHFRDRNAVALDLHWHLFLDSTRAVEADREMWEASVPMTLEDGTRTAVPAAADLLFHVCVHGIRWSNTSPIRWVTDALAILGPPALAIDWDRLLHQAKLRRLVVPLREAVSYLCDTFDAPVPENVRDKLRAFRASRLEEIEYDLFLRGTPALSAAQMALFHGLRYARLTEGAGIVRRLAGFPNYLGQHWNAGRVSQLPRIILRKSLARLRKKRIRL